MEGISDDDRSLGSIYNDTYFVIPDYQRDYAWEESNVEDLLDDLDFIHGENYGENPRDITHYFGTIVLEERGSYEPTNFEEFDVYGIVDGQQRLATICILISAMTDELDRIKNDRRASDEMVEKVEETRNNWKGGYLKYKDRAKLEIGGLAEDIYVDSILGDVDSQSILQNDTDLLEVERKILNAKQTIIERLQEWEQSKTDGDDLGDYVQLLNKLFQTVTQKFEINIRVVNDVDEAARMFKVINNRGRGLRLHDKVKSHLVYCASQSKRLDSEEVYRAFNRIVSNITIHKGLSDDDIDSLVKTHWTVFTSERSDSRAKRPGPVDIHRRLSDVDDFANVQRDDFEIFVSYYLESLERFSERYPYLSDRDRFAKKYSGKTIAESEYTMEEVVRKVQCLYMHNPVRFAIAPMLIATAEKFNVASSEFASIVDELEKLVFKYTLVMAHGSQGYRNTLQSEANNLYWSDIDTQDVFKIFNSESNRYVGYQSKELGFKKTKERIVEKTQKIAPIGEVAENYLKEDDVLSGEYSPGWGGVRSHEVIKYLMYELELSLRGASGTLSLSPYHEFKNDFDVEHLVPKNAEKGDRLANHEQNRNRIGNLALLSTQENISEGNASYREKYNKIYQDSTLKILRTLGTDEFKVGDIAARENDQILPFIQERWK
jgi:hypothetical protein